MKRIDPAGIDAVLLDAGNTLVFLDLERLLPPLRDAGVPVDVERLRSAEESARGVLRQRFGQGSTGLELEVWRAYFLELLARVGVPEERISQVAEGIRALHAQRHLWTRVHPETRGALARLRADGYRLGVVSNADGRMEATLKEVGLRDLFEVVLDSEVVGTAKPDPAIYRDAAQRMEVDPHRCLYAGDLVPVDVEGAWRAGMEAVLVDPTEAPTEVEVLRIPSIRELPSLLEGRLASLEGP